MNAQQRHGFLLSNSSRDVGQHTEVEYWLATDEGPVRLCVALQKQIFFIPAQDKETAWSLCAKYRGLVSFKELELKTFSGQAVVGVYCDTLHVAYQLQKSFKAASIEVLEGDIRAHERYLIERFIYGSLSFSGERVSDSRLTDQNIQYAQYSQVKVKPSHYQPALSAISLDIECAMNGELFSIGLAGDYTSNDSSDCTSKHPGDTDGQPIREVLMIGTPEPCATQVRWFANEKSLLLGLVERIALHDPDLIIGWNVVNFDFQVLMKRAQRHGLQLALGRANTHATWRADRNDRHKGYITVPGRMVIDGIAALKSATWSFDSFSLENVAQTLLNKGKKVARTVEDRVAEIVHNFHHDKPALAAYNLQDCTLVLEVFKHTNIIDYLVLRSQMTGLELDRIGGSVAAFTNLYLPHLHRGGYIAPNLPADGGLASPGGYVMDSKPGLYRNVLVLDFKSLYPSIIRTFKVDPMGLIEGLANPEQSIPGFRGAKFDREKHFLPKIISDLWQQRDHAKKNHDGVRSQAIKIIMNSFYGVLGSGGCRFYDTRLASSITMRGHEIMQTTSQWIEQQGYTVIYGDTDSTFVSLDDHLSPSACRDIGQQLTDHINQQWRTHLQQQYQLECLLEIEFETHFSRFLMPTIRGSDTGSKKRYAGLTVDTKTEQETIIFKGLENVRTDWTQLARSFQAQLFDRIFHEQDPTELVQSTVNEVLTGQRDADLVYSKRLRRKLSHYVKNVPPQVRAARLADQENQRQGKSLKYQNKGLIAYLITNNGPEPVEYQHSPIDYDHYIEKQLKPIADGILPFVGLNFDRLISAQGELF